MNVIMESLLNHKIIDYKCGYLKIDKEKINAVVIKAFYVGARNFSEYEQEPLEKYLLYYKDYTSFIAPNLAEYFFKKFNNQENSKKKEVSFGF